MTQTPKNGMQIREANARRLLEFIQTHGPLSKRELQYHTKLSWSVVSTLTTKMIENGQVVLTDKQHTTAGRKPTELDINPYDYLIIGLDINLSGLRALLTDLKGRTIQKWERRVTNYDGDVLINEIMNLIDTVCKAYQHKHMVGIGLAVQGIVDVEKGISVHFPQIQNWSNVMLQDIIEQKYGIPTVLMHDPDCIMSAEIAHGRTNISRDKNVILVRLDAGIGVSIMLNGQLYFGATSVAGEIAHINMDSDGAQCRCGNRGCLEEYVTGVGLIRRFEEAVANGGETGLTLGELEEQGYSAIIQAAQSGDRLCRQLFTQLGNYLGRGISTLINILNPHTIVFYGELTSCKSLYYSEMMKLINRHIYHNTTCDILFSGMDYYAAALGAALQAADRYINLYDYVTAK